MLVKLFLGLLIFSGCFGLLPFANNAYVVLTILGLSIFAFSTTKKKNDIFTPYIIGIFVSLILCSVSSYYFRGQSFYYSFLGSKDFFNLLFFYYLLSLAPTKKDMETFIVLSIIIVSVAYFIQLSIFPKALFVGASQDWIQNSTFPYRMMYVGCYNIISFSLFFFLNKYLVQKKMIYLLCLFLPVSVLMIRGFRTMLGAAIIASIYLVVKVKGLKNISFKSSALFGILVAFLISCIYVLMENNSIVQDSLQAIVERNDTQNFSNDDYIRLLNLNYFLHDHFQSPIEYILGSGIPTGPNNYMENKLALFNFNYVDLGLLGLSFVGGIPLVFFILTIWFKCFKAKVACDIFYIKSYFLYIFIVSLTDPEAYTRGCFFVQAMLMYLVSKFSINNSKYEH